MRELLNVVDIKLNRDGSIIAYKVPADRCEHSWELHLWEHGRAFCNRCGSFAIATNDPREAKP
jgi:hypothetical protein